MLEVSTHGFAFARRWMLSVLNAKNFIINFNKEVMRFRIKTH